MSDSCLLVASCEEIEVLDGLTIDGVRAAVVGKAKSATALAEEHYGRIAADDGG